MFGNKKQDDKIVIALQKLVLAKDSDILEILRMSHMVFSELGRQDLVKWIETEQSGYPEKVDVPEYRKIPSNIGYKPIGVFHNGYGQYATQTGYDPLPYPINIHAPQSIGFPISEIVLYAKSKNIIYMPVSDKIIQDLQATGMFNHPCEFAWIISSSSIFAIESQIKDAISKAISELKSLNVFGDNWMFTETEKQKVSNYQFGIFNSLRISNEQ